jgi:hypothetical protein
MRRVAAGAAPTRSQLRPNISCKAVPGSLRQRQWVNTLRVLEANLAKRARRALTRWPLTELDPIERAELAAALHEAHSFDDLAPGWQELIRESEAGAPRNPHEFHLHLRGHA